MRIKGIKRGQTIELLEQINNIPDGVEIIVDVLVSPNQIGEIGKTLSNEEKLSQLNQLFGAWQNQPELVEIFTEIEEQRHVYRGRNIDAIENQDKQ